MPVAGRVKDVSAFNVMKQKDSGTVSGQSTTPWKHWEPYNCEISNSHGQFIYGKYVQEASGGQTYARSCPISTTKPKSGSILAEALSNYAQNIGIFFYENIIVIDLLTSGKSVEGCVGFDLKKGEVVVILAKSTIGIPSFEKIHISSSRDGISIKYDHEAISWSY